MQLSAYSGQVGGVRHDAVCGHGMGALFFGSAFREYHDLCGSLCCSQPAGSSDRDGERRGAPVFRRRIFPVLSCGERGGAVVVPWPERDGSAGRRRLRAVRRLEEPGKERKCEL